MPSHGSSSGPWEERVVEPIGMSALACHAWPAMFERFTSELRQVLFFARHDASQLGSPAIEPSHLLLGLLRGPKGEGRHRSAAWPRSGGRVGRAAGGDTRRGR
jgi:hypothetical protein